MKTGLLQSLLSVTPDYTMATAACHGDGRVPFAGEAAIPGHPHRPAFPGTVIDIHPLSYAFLRFHPG